MSRTATALLLAACAAVYGIAVLAQIRVDETRDAIREDLLYLPNEKLLSHFTAGLDSVVADLLWLQCVQYTGAQVKGDRDFRWLAQMIQTVVRLDPYFSDAYRYGAMFLATLNADDQAALDLLGEGFVRTPRSYVFPYEMGMIYLLNRKDAPESRMAAVRYFSIAVQRPDAPDFLPVLVSSLSDAADLEGFEETMWQQRLQMAQARGDELIEQLAQRKLIELRVRQFLKAVNAHIDAHVARGGHRAASFEELLAAGAITQEMYDARNNDGLGGRFILDADGVARSTGILDDTKQSLLNQIRDALDAYHAAQGAWPLSLEALVDAGKLRGVPVHPYPGAQWDYDPATGSVR